MLQQHAKLLMSMTHYDKGDTARIQHFIKVHNLATVIGTLEGLDEETQFILETASILHDIGIRKSIEKYGFYTWKYQELEGPDEAEALMHEVGGYTEEQVQRVRYLIAHHHTYDKIDGLDYQILVEADFLVNLFESQNKKKYEAILQQNLFRTETGIRLLKDMFGQY